MPFPVDALTSPTLKHLREQWWNDEFTAFLAETLRPRAGNRILDVGCGQGGAEVRLGRLQISQIALYGVDIKVDEVTAAAHEVAAHNQRARFAAGDACRLPFASRSFDSTFCVAVLQHVADVDAAIREFARVTRPGGRVIVVEPDNGARYAYTSSPNGQSAFRLAAELFAAAATARADNTHSAIGVQVPELFASQGIEPLDVRIFPVSHTQIGVPADAVWTLRRQVVEALLPTATDAVKALAQRYLRALQAYEADARAAGAAFFEIQNTLLFANVGQNSEA